MTAAQTLERCFTENNSYGAAACVTAVPNSWTVSQGDYAIAFTSRTATAYTLTATATGVLANDTYCAVFTLTNSGVKTGTHSDRKKQKKSKQTKGSFPCLFYWRRHR